LTAKTPKQELNKDLNNNINTIKLGMKPNSTKNRGSIAMNPNNYNSILVNSIPEEIHSDNKQFARYNSQSDYIKKDDDKEINSNRTPIEKNVSNFANKKNEDLFRETMRTPFNPFQINPLSINIEE